jgi:hypothetical protein
MVCAVFRAVWQTDGWTPLLAATYFGHVECVRTLLGGGAEINKATVGCACSMGGAVCMGMFGSLCACIHSWSGALGCGAAVGSGDMWSNQTHICGGRGSMMFGCCTRVR